jgi:Domain of unknown function (DUF4381)
MRHALRTTDYRLGPVCIVSVCSLIIATASFGMEYQQKQGSATVRVEAEKIDAGRLEVRLSDEVPLAVSVEGGQDLEVQPFQPLPRSDDWVIRLDSAPQRIPLAAGRVRWLQKFRLAPLKPGELSLSLAPLRFRVNASEDRWEEAVWQPIPVNVTTEIYRADLSELRDVAPPEELPPEPSWGIPLAWAGLAVVLVLLLLSGWALMKRRGRGDSPVPPRDWAVRELETLVLPLSFTDRDVEHFYTRLSDVLRKYVELRYHLPAPEQTTAEFLETLRGSPELHDEGTAMCDLLERCDLVKFARAQSSAEECRTAVEMARAFIEQTAAPGGNDRKTGPSGQMSS